jgi:hypothetical protein
METPKAKPLIPKGTYVPSNLSYEALRQQALRNNPNTRRSPEDTTKDLGCAPISHPVSRKLIAKTAS